MREKTPFLGEYPRSYGRLKRLLISGAALAVIWGSVFAMVISLLHK